MTDKKILVVYTYFKSPSADYNLQFFHDYAISYKENIDFILVINGYECSIELKELSNFYIIKRQNLGYDFGGHSAALKFINSNNKKYDYYFFMNSGVIGPIIPHYLEEEHHWTDYFIGKINEKVKLVGTTIVCMKEKELKLYGPRVEGFFFLTDQKGLDLMIEDGNIFKNHKTKFGAIINGEYGLGRCILKNGYNMDCMLNYYQNIDWRLKENWHMNDYKHPSRHNSFYGKSINPYEVIFHKWYWHEEINLVHFEIIQEYVNKKYNKKIEFDIGFKNIEKENDLIDFNILEKNVDNVKMEFKEENNKKEIECLSIENKDTNIEGEKNKLKELGLDESVKKDINFLSNNTKKEEVIKNNNNFISLLVDNKEKENKESYQNIINRKSNELNNNEKKDFLSFQKNNNFQNFGGNSRYNLENIKNNKAYLSAQNAKKDNNDIFKKYLEELYKSSDLNYSNTNMNKNINQQPQQENMDIQNNIQGMNKRKRGGKQRNNRNMNNQKNKRFNNNQNNNNLIINEQIKQNNQLSQIKQNNPINQLNQQKRMNQNRLNQMRQMRQNQIRQNQLRKLNNRKNNLQNQNQKVNQSVNDIISNINSVNLNNPINTNVNVIRNQERPKNNRKNNINRMMNRKKNGNMNKNRNLNKNKNNNQNQNKNKKEENFYSIYH